MKAVNVSRLKTELRNRSPKELLEICLRLSKFKKENKELLTYLLLEADDEAAYIESVKEEIDAQFEQINRKNYHFIRKGVRKVLTNVKKYIRYSGKKETEVELLLHFCTQLKAFQPSIRRSTRLQNVFHRQVELIRKRIATLHEDLQYDYGLELEELIGSFNS